MSVPFLVVWLFFKGSRSTFLWILNLKEGIDDSALLVASPDEGTADMSGK